MQDIYIKKWNASVFLKVLSIPPLLGVSVGIFDFFEPYRKIGVGDAFQLSILIAFGVFMFGLGKSVKITNEKLISNLTWFSFSIRKNEYMLCNFAHIQVSPKTSTHTGGIGDGSRMARYVSINFKGRTYHPDYDLAQHAHFGRGDKDIAKLGQFLIDLSNVCPLKMKVEGSLLDKFGEVGVQLPKNQAIERE
jgi:hypothetical protein